MARLRVSDFDEDQLLRDVTMEEVIGRVYRLRVWDTYKTGDHGKSRLAYRFERIKPKAEAEVVFEGDEFFASPMEPIDSDATLRSLMGYLTLRPGDTDEEYFESYTPKQMGFAESYDAEAMRVLGMEREEEEGDEEYEAFREYEDNPKSTASGSWNVARLDRFLTGAEEELKQARHAFEQSQRGKRYEPQLENLKYSANQVKRLMERLLANL